MAKNWTARWWRLTRREGESRRQWAGRVARLDPLDHPRLAVAIKAARSWLHGKCKACHKQATAT